MRRTAWLCGAVCLLSFGCGDSGGDTNVNSACAEGYQSDGPACVPIFDSCPGAAEIPVLGGGCLAVGVTACATGLFESDGQGGCEPILPAQTCPPGTLGALGSTECQQVGVGQCAAGFQGDGEGGCDAALPADPCSTGFIATLGQTACQPLGDCGTGTWGNIVDDGVTIYVDASADATGADGSAAAPFVTVGDALAAAQPGGQVALAAGEYVERLNVNDEVRLTGRCAELVTLRGVVFLGNPEPPVTLSAGASGSTVSGVTLTGPEVGLAIQGAQQVTVEEVQVVDTLSYGVTLTSEAAAVLRRVKVSGCRTIGVAVLGSELELVDSVVRGSLPRLSDGQLGRGLDAECSSSGACGSLRVSGSLIETNTELGLVTIGVDSVVSASVIRDSRAQSNGLNGRGLSAQCHSDGVCPSLEVTGSAIEGNLEFGVVLMGAQASFTDTVIRDTLPSQGDGAVGRGIDAYCDPALGSCGSLELVNCLISGNRQLGLHATGVDVTVTGSVIRDTLPGSDGTYGRGIDVECDPGLSTCGRLTVTDSLVTGNRSVGLAAHGADVAISGSVIRDTLAQQSDGLYGRGVVAECHVGLGRCGSLRLTESVIAGNQEVGVFVFGVDAEITASLIRDTLPQELDERFGRGIVAQCDPALGACGALEVSGSVAASNRDVGVSLQGVHATISQSVVRDTLPKQSDSTFGVGITAHCTPGIGQCGSLAVSHSLIVGNRLRGIIASGVDTTVTSSIVRDTLPQVSDDSGGWGINTQCDGQHGICGILNVVSSLVSESTAAGIVVYGSHTQVTGTLVRDTFPRASDGRYGRGLVAQCDPDVFYCGDLNMVASVIQGSENAGLFIARVPATLEGVAVLDTRPNEAGPWADQFGQGIWALCDSSDGSCATLQMTSCLVESSTNAGLAVQGVSGFVTTSAIRQVEPQLDGTYGFGVQLEGLAGQSRTTFNVLDCAVRDAKLSGILYYLSGGTLSGSVVSGGEFSVVMNVGSEPTILDDNQLSGTAENDPQWTTLLPSPAPEPTLPQGL
ncbi:MAG: right-handed parallel beta-helix repeat-containing protein [bacterium]